MEPHIAIPDKTQADPRDTRPQKKVGRVFLNSEGHVSERGHMRLQEKVFRVTDLVTADATRPSDDLLAESGQIYLCIRQAFAAAFDELLEQIIAPEQATVVEELWTFLSDYLDRMAARADVAINEAALHQGVREQLEREVRLLRARCNVLEGQLREEKLDLETATREVTHQPVPNLGGPLPETSGKESQPQDVSGAAGASLLQAKLAGLAGRPRSAAAAAKLERAASGKSTSMRRVAQEAGCLVEEITKCAVESTPIGERLGVFSAAGVGLGMPGAAAAPKAAQGTSALRSRRDWLSSGKPPAPESAQEYSVKADREKWQAAQRGLMHKLEEQLVGISTRGSGRLSDAAPATGPILELELATDMDDPVPLCPGGESPRVISPEVPAVRQPVVVTSTRPTSIAQRASMTVWGRYLAKRPTMLSSSVSEAERVGASVRASLPHLSLPCCEQQSGAACGPLAEGIRRSTAQSTSREEPLTGRRGTSVDALRHSCPVDTRGMVLTPMLVTAQSSEHQSTSKSLALSPVRSPVRRRALSACAPEDEALATVLDRSVAAALHPEQVALALAAEPTPRPTVSSEILAAATHSHTTSTTAETPVLFAPRAGRHRHNLQAVAAETGLSDVAEPEKVPSPPVTRDLRESRHSFATPTKLERVPSPPFAHAAQEPHRLLASPTERTQSTSSANAQVKVRARPGSSGGGGFARASLADWGRVRGAERSRGGASPGEVPRSSPGISPGSVGGPALVVHSPVWSFDAAGLPTDRSTRPDAPTPDTPHVRFAQHREPVDTTPLGGGKPGEKEGNAASASLVDAAHDQGPTLDRSISFVCRQVTSSLPDLCFAAAAPPEPSPAAAAATAPSATEALPVAAASPPQLKEDERSGTAIAQSGEAVSGQASKAVSVLEAAASLQPAPAESSSAQGFSSKLISRAAQAHAAKGKAAMAAPVEAATASVCQAASAPAVRPAVTEVGDAAAQTTVTASPAGPSDMEAACSSAEANACTAGAISTAEAVMGAGSRAEAQLPAEAQISTKCNAASASAGAVINMGSHNLPAKQAVAVAVATQPAMSPSEAKHECSAKPAKQVAPVAAAVAQTSVSFAKAEAGSLSVAFSAPLPQTDLAVDWKPAAKSAAPTISNPWAVGIAAAASFSTGAVSGCGSQGLFSTPAPMMAPGEVDAETFHTAGDEVLEEAGDTAESPAEQLHSRSDKPATQEGCGESTAAPQAAGSDATQGVDEGGPQGKGKGASMPEKCRRAMQSIKSTCEAVGSMAAAKVPALCSSGGGVSDDESSDDAGSHSTADTGSDSSDDEDTHAAEGDEDSQWESGTSESESAADGASEADSLDHTAESADESDNAAGSATGAEASSETDNEESGAESKQQNDNAGDMSAGLLRTISTELDVDDIMSMTVAELDTCKIRGVSEAGGCSVESKKVVSLEVFARPSSTAAAVVQESSKADGKAEELKSPAEASSNLPGTLGTVKFPLPADLLLPDSLFNSPAAQAAEADTGFTLRRRSGAKGRRGGRRGRA
ncbi:g2394 [Coccomyxa elongata]